MVSWILNIAVDISRPNRTRNAIYGGIASRSDQYAHTINLTVNNAGAGVDISGASAVAYCKRADGTTVLVEGTISDNIATIVLPAECYAVIGVCSVLIRIEKAELTSVAVVDYNVVERITDAVVDPGEILPSLSEISSMAKSAVASATAIAQAIAIKETATGATVSFDDGADGIPMPHAIASISGTQSGSGDASPSNIRDITAYKSCTVTHGDGNTSATATISWNTSACEVYDGTIDFSTGILTVDHMVATLTTIGQRTLTDLGDVYRLSITYINADGTTQNSNNHIDLFETDTDDTFANWLPQGAHQYSKNEAGYYLYGTNGVYMKFPKSAFPGCSTESEYRAAINDFLSEHPLKIVIGKLSNPQFQLTPQQISSLLGANVISADTGDLSVTYCADTKLYIDGLLEA